MADPKRGEAWLVDLDPTKGREQAGKRPALVVSADGFNGSPAGLVIVLPITSKDKRIRSHVPVDPPEGGLRQRSFKVRRRPLGLAGATAGRWGSVTPATMAEIEDRLRILLDL
ncbi:MAG TPA: type II toxin-antitoxin system PemK/MazF family toxin, partial [Planctomycetaceae bacterium]